MIDLNNHKWEEILLNLFVILLFVFLNPFYALIFCGVLNLMSPRISFWTFSCMFAFPFGQPDTCFSGRQIELLLENGAKKVFSTYPVINSDISAPYLHRIPLHTLNNTKSRIWFNILRRNFKI